VDDGSDHSDYNDKIDIKPHNNTKEPRLVHLPVPQIGPDPTPTHRPNSNPFTGVSGEDRTTSESGSKSKAVGAGEGVKGITTKRTSLFSKL
jgi:hypothetical protein